VRNAEFALEAERVLRVCVVEPIGMVELDRERVATEVV
jgi:hypothetical protein